MRKMKLNPEDLAVDSFATATRSDGRGTVRGLAYGEMVDEAIAITDPQPVSNATCQTLCNQNTCAGSCGITCSTCNDPTCNSCVATGCYTGNQPVCCA